MWPFGQFSQNGIVCTNPRSKSVSITKWEAEFSRSMAFALRSATLLQEFQAGRRICAAVHRPAVVVTMATNPESGELRRLRIER